MARLTSTADLRRVINEPRPATRSKILDALDEQSIDFLKRCPFALVGTTAADGTIEVSPKGDEPGFIRVEDPKTLLIPERVGNNLAFGLSNILATGKIGLIALVPATGETLRVSGTAEIFDDADLVSSLGSLGKPALLATRWCGDDARYAARVGQVSPPLEGHGLKPGDRLECAMFPKVL